MPSKMKKELEKEKKELVRPSRFLGTVVSLMSFAQGAHMILVDDFMMNLMETYLFGLNEDILGWSLIALGLLKFIGLVADNENMRVFGILGLAFIWGLTFTASFFFSFGVGYPDNSYLWTFLMVVLCVRIAHNGVVK